MDIFPRGVSWKRVGVAGPGEHARKWSCVVREDNRSESCLTAWRNRSQCQNRSVKSISGCIKYMEQTLEWEAGFLQSPQWQRSVHILKNSYRGSHLSGYRTSWCRLAFISSPSQIPHSPLDNQHLGCFQYLSGVSPNGIKLQYLALC